MFTSPTLWPAAAAHFISASLATFARRVFQHKWREHEGFTADYNCDRLIWFERYQEIAQAIAREKQLKRWRREKKIGLIEKTNPAWVDLSREWYDLEPADLKRATDRMNT